MGLNIEGIQEKDKPRGTSERESIEEKRIAYEREREAKSQEIGWIGKPLGDKNHAPINLISLVVVIVIISLLVIAYTDESIRPSITETLKILLMSGLSFLAGRKMSSSNGNSSNP